MGTPEFALPTLERLSGQYSIVGVVTQPDRPYGRGRRLVASPVKEMALAEGIPVFQPERLRSVEAVEHVRAWVPDLMVVAAYGQILPTSVLNLAKFGVLNVHASLLPRWRGASPIQGAILAGDSTTGITIMKMDKGLDTGPILAMREIAIKATEDAGALESRMAEIGADLLLDILPNYLAGRLLPQAQPEEGVTITRRIPKKAAAIDWSCSAQELCNHVRAFAPVPGAYTTWNGSHFKVLATRVADENISHNAQPGTVFLNNNMPIVVTGSGCLVLMQVQMAGKRPMDGNLFVRGRKNFLGAQLGSQPPGE